MMINKGKGISIVKCCKTKNTQTHEVNAKEKYDHKIKFNRSAQTRFAVSGNLPSLRTAPRLVFRLKQNKPLLIPTMYTVSFCCVCPYSGRSLCCLRACCWVSASFFPSWLTSTLTWTLSSWRRCIRGSQKGWRTTLMTWRKELMTCSWTKRQRAPDCNISHHLYFDTSRSDWVMKMKHIFLAAGFRV